MPRENNSNKHNCHLFFHNAFNPIAELSKLSSSDALNVDELRFIKVAGQHTDTFLGEKKHLVQYNFKQRGAFLYKSNSNIVTGDHHFEQNFVAV